ncbi:hypothetical protein A2333_00350 [Candidatus Wolfebacteria bacterium RIFOXYB2_FULL_49_7]|nr:MAG: hypothetical protein A2333_00350 [Candidatus Wolfebacteria bacterium RIFOXYB2_FULL_49_7]
MACALSFIGSLVSLELGAYWWAGLALGFVAGYIGYDARSIVSAISLAFTETCKKVSMPSVHIPKERAKLMFYGFGAGASAMMTAMLTFFGCGFLSEGVNPFLCASYFTAVAIPSLICGLLCMVPSEANNLEHASKIIKVAHPIPFFCWTLPRGIIWVIVRIPTAVAIAYRFCATFICTTFKYVHSNARLLFGIDVAIGVAVGHYTGSALLGGLAGGAWWLLDWHLISVKVMGLKAA